MAAWKPYTIIREPGHAKLRGLLHDAGDMKTLEVGTQLSMFQRILDFRELTCQPSVTGQRWGTHTDSPYTAANFAEVNLQEVAWLMQESGRMQSAPKKYIDCSTWRI